MSYSHHFSRVMSFALWRCTVDTWLQLWRHVTRILCACDQSWIYVIYGHMHGTCMSVKHDLFVWHIYVILITQMLYLHFLHFYCLCRLQFDFISKMFIDTGPTAIFIPVFIQCSHYLYRSFQLIITRDWPVYNIIPESQIISMFDWFRIAIKSLLIMYLCIFT